MPPPKHPRNAHLLQFVQLQDEIEVWWPHDRKYYAGRITKALSRNRYRIEYNDGEIENLKLETEQWRFCGDARERIQTLINNPLHRNETFSPVSSQQRDQSSLSSGHRISHRATAGKAKSGHGRSASPAAPAASSTSSSRRRSHSGPLPYLDRRKKQAASPLNDVSDPSDAHSVSPKRHTTASLSGSCQPSGSQFSPDPLRSVERPADQSFHEPKFEECHHEISELRGNPISSVEQLSSRDPSRVLSDCKESSSMQHTSADKPVSRKTSFASKPFSAIQPIANSLTSPPSNLEKSGSPQYPNNPRKSSDSGKSSDLPRPLNERKSYEERNMVNVPKSEVPDSTPNATVKLKPARSSGGIHFPALSGELAQAKLSTDKVLPGRSPDADVVEIPVSLKQYGDNVTRFQSRKAGSLPEKSSLAIAPVKLVSQIEERLVNTVPSHKFVSTAVQKPSLPTSQHTNSSDQKDQVSAVAIGSRPAPGNPLPSASASQTHFVSQVPPSDSLGETHRKTNWSTEAPVGSQPISTVPNDVFVSQKRLSVQPSGTCEQDNLHPQPTAQEQSNAKYLIPIQKTSLTGPTFKHSISAQLPLSGPIARTSLPVPPSASSRSIIGTLPISALLTEPEMPTHKKDLVLNSHVGNDWPEQNNDNEVSVKTEDTEMMGEAVPNEHEGHETRTNLVPVVGKSAVDNIRPVAKSSPQRRKSLPSPSLINSSTKNHPEMTSSQPLSIQASESHFVPVSGLEVERTEGSRLVPSATHVQPARQGVSVKEVTTKATEHVKGNIGTSREHSQIDNSLPAILSVPKPQSDFGSPEFSVEEGADGVVQKKNVKCKPRQFVRAEVNMQSRSIVKKRKINVWKDGKLAANCGSTIRPDDVKNFQAESLATTNHMKSVSVAERHLPIAPPHVSTAAGVQKNSISPNLSGGTSVPSAPKTADSDVLLFQCPTSDSTFGEVIVISDYPVDAEKNREILNVPSQSQLRGRLSSNDSLERPLRGSQKSIPTQITRKASKVPRTAIAKGIILESKADTTLVGTGKDIFGPQSDLKAVSFENGKRNGAEKVSVESSVSLKKNSDGPQRSIASSIVPSPGDMPFVSGPRARSGLDNDVAIKDSSHVKSAHNLKAPLVKFSPNDQAVLDAKTAPINISKGLQTVSSPRGNISDGRDLVPEKQSIQTTTPTSFKTTNDSRNQIVSKSPYPKSLISPKHLGTSREGGNITGVTPNIPLTSPGGILVKTSPVAKGLSKDLFSAPALKGGVGSGMATGSNSVEASRPKSGFMGPEAANVIPNPRSNVYPVSGGLSAIRDKLRPSMQKEDANLAECFGKRQFHQVPVNSIKRQRMEVPFKNVDTAGTEVDSTSAITLAAIPNTSPNAGRAEANFGRSKLMSKIPLGDNSATKRPRPQISSKAQVKPELIPQPMSRSSLGRNNEQSTVAGNQYINASAVVDANGGTLPTTAAGRGLNGSRSRQGPLISQNVERGTASLPLDILMRTIAESNRHALSNKLTPLTQRLEALFAANDERVNMVLQKVEGIDLIQSLVKNVSTVSMETTSSKKLINKLSNDYEELRNAMSQLAMRNEKERVQIEVRKGVEMNQHVIVSDMKTEFAGLKSEIIELKQKLNVLESSIQSVPEIVDTKLKMVLQKHINSVELALQHQNTTLDLKLRNIGEIENRIVDKMKLSMRHFFEDIQKESALAVTQAIQQTFQVMEEANNVVERENVTSGIRKDENDNEEGFARGFFSDNDNGTRQNDETDIVSKNKNHDEDQDVQGNTNSSSANEIRRSDLRGRAGTRSGMRQYGNEKANTGTVSSLENDKNGRKALHGATGNAGNGKGYGENKSTRSDRVNAVVTTAVAAGDNGLNNLINESDIFVFSRKARIEAPSGVFKPQRIGRSDPDVKMTEASNSFRDGKSMQKNEYNEQIHDNEVEEGEIEGRSIGRIFEKDDEKDDKREKQESPVHLDETIKRQMRELLGRAVVKWLLDSRSRSHAPKNERAEAVLSVWVKESTERCLREVMNVLQTFKAIEEAMRDLQLELSKRTSSVELDWLMDEPTSSNIAKARCNYEQWEPPLLEYEWNLDRRVITNVACHLKYAEDKVFENSTRDGVVNVLNVAKIVVRIGLDRSSGMVTRWNETK